MKKISLLILAMVLVCGTAVAMQTTVSVSDEEGNVENCREYKNDHWQDCPEGEDNFTLEDNESDEKPESFKNNKRYAPPSDDGCYKHHLYLISSSDPKISGDYSWDDRIDCPEEKPIFPVTEDGHTEVDCSRAGVTCLNVEEKPKEDWDVGAEN